MKRDNKTLLRHGFAMVIGFGLLCAASVAQEAAPAQRTPAKTAKAKAVDLKLSQKIQKYKVDIYEPTTVDDFIASIRKQTPTPINFVLSRNMGAVLIPPMELHQVSVEAALNAVDVATDYEVQWEDGGEVIYITRDSDAGVEYVHVVDASDILTDSNEASLLSAIEIGLEMVDSSKENVVIKLHKETDLLFIKGKSAEIDVVMQIVSKLGGQPWPLPRGGGGGFGGGPAKNAGNQGGGGVF